MGSIYDEMETANFNHGGDVHGKADASDAGAELLRSIMSKYKGGDYAARDSREEAFLKPAAPADAALIEMVAKHKRKKVEQAEAVPQSPQYTFGDSLSSAADQAVDKLSVAGPALGVAAMDGASDALSTVTASLASAAQSVSGVGESMYDSGRDMLKGIRDTARDAYRDYTDGSIVEAQMEEALTPTMPTITARSTYDDETSSVMPEGSLLYPKVLESNKAVYGNLWGGVYHTKLEGNAAGQKLYTENVKAHLIPYSRYVNIIAPILNKVIPAFAGDSRVKGDRLYRAMLEIGAAESNGADRSQLYNSTTGASGPFQTLASSVKDSVSRQGYYGPKAEKLTGKSKKEILSMSKSEIETWMKTDFTSNAVFGTIELIKLAKGQADIGNPQYLSQLTGTNKIRDDEPLPKERKLDLTKWNEMITK